MQRREPSRGYLAFLWLAFSFGIVAGCLLIAEILVMSLAGWNAASLVLGIIFLIFLSLTGGFLLPGILLRNRFMFRKDVGDQMRIYRRIKPADLASKMGRSESDVRRAMLDAVTLGFVQGYFDRNTDEFFTPDAVVQSITVKQCPTCKAPVDQVNLLGETVKCSYCGSAIPFQNK